MSERADACFLPRRFWKKGEGTREKQFVDTSFGLFCAIGVVQREGEKRGRVEKRACVALE
jgi:hypothetical protein